MPLYIPDPDPTVQPSPRVLRITGWVMTACGVSLIWMMTGLLVGFTYVLIHNGQRGFDYGFTGGPWMAAFIYGLFTTILVFGFAAARSGIYQVRHRQRAPHMLRWARLMIAFMSIAGVAVQILDLILD